MVWGMLPELYKNVSWESHMLGFVSGIILAVWFKNEGPQSPVYDWMEEEEEGEGERGRREIEEEEREKGRGGEGETK